MLKSRNDMIHIYNSQAAKQMVDIIVQKYISAFEKLQEEILKIYKYIFNEIWYTYVLQKEPFKSAGSIIKLFEENINTTRQILNIADTIKKNSEETA